MRKILLLLSICIAFGCKKDMNERTIIYNIEAELVYISPRPPFPPTYPANIPAMKLVETGSKDTVYLTLERIEGFTYTEGYKYKIKVKVIPIKNRPADGPDEEYILMEILSKEKI